MTDSAREPTRGELLTLWNAVAVLASTDPAEWLSKSHLHSEFHAMTGRVGVVHPSPAPRLPEREEIAIKRPIQSWEVEVRINGSSGLTIGHNHLAGMENIDEFRDVVENCARHLMSFISGRELGGQLDAAGASAAQPSGQGDLK